MMIRTQRLLLRPAFPEDAREMFAAINEQGLVRMLARAPWPYLPEHAEAHCAAPLDPLALRFVIVLPGERGAPIVGMIGIEDSVEELELDCWIAQGWRRRGFASEAVAAVLDAAAMLGHRAVNASHWLDNPASGKVLAACGFAETGEVRPAHCLGRGGELVLARRYACDLRERVGMPVAA